MPFGPAAGAGIWAAQGAYTSARQARLMLADNTHKASGVASPGDLIVRAKSPASNGVQVWPGGFIANGRENTNQGSYTEHLVSTDNTSLDGQFSDNNTASPRYDMVCVRVEDPSADGTWNHDPGVDPISYLRVIPNVNSNPVRLTLEGVRPNQTGVALALVRIPANTANPSIQNSWITDLRRVANPLFETFADTVNHPGSDELLGGTQWKDWPQTATWDLPVPQWATELDVAIVTWGVDLVAANGPAQGDPATISVGIEVNGQGRFGVQDHQQVWTGWRMRSTIGRGTSFAVVNNNHDWRGQYITLKSVGWDKDADPTTQFQADFATVSRITVNFRQDPSLGHFV